MGDEVGKIRLRTRLVEVRTAVVEVGTAFVEVWKIRPSARFVEVGTAPKGSEL